MAKRPKVTMEVEVEYEYDVTSVLDSWSLEEVREFVEDQDEEGIMCLRDSGKLLDEDHRWPSFGGTSLDDYLAWREANQPDQRRKHSQEGSP